MRALAKTLLIVALLLGRAFAQTCPSGTPVTSNLGLYVPVQNSTNWGYCLNLNFISLDSLLSGNSVLPSLRINGTTTVQNLVVNGTCTGSGCGGTVYPSGTGIAVVTGGTAWASVYNASNPIPINFGGNGTSTPQLVAGTNITLSGSWPAYTINATSAGNTTSTTLTTGFLPKSSGANSIVNSALDDGATTASTLTYTGGNLNITNGALLTGGTLVVATGVKGGWAGAFNATPFTPTANQGGMRVGATCFIATINGSSEACLPSSAGANITINSSGVISSTGGVSLGGDVNGSSGALLVNRAHWDVHGGVTVITTYTVGANDYQIVLDATTGAFAINLPAATNSGRELNFKKLDASGNGVTLTPNGGDTIDNNATQIMNTQYANQVLVDSAPGKWYKKQIIAMGGDVTGASNATTVAAINGTNMAALGTGILFNTTGTGIPSITTIGSGLNLTGSTLTATGSGGNVSNVGTPLIHQVGVWTGALTIKGVTAGTNNQVLNGNTGADPSFGALPTGALSTVQGNGSAVQLAASGTSGQLAQFDSNLNVANSGILAANIGTQPTGTGLVFSTAGTPDVYNTVTGTSSVTSAQGNGAKVQLSTSTTTTNDCVKFDANGNTVDAGGPCGVSTGGAQGAFSGTTGSVNAAFGTYQYFRTTLTGNITAVNASNLPSLSQSGMIEVIQAASGGPYSVTWSGTGVTLVGNPLTCDTAGATMIATWNYSVGASSIFLFPVACLTQNFSQALTASAPSLTPTGTEVYFWPANGTTRSEDSGGLFYTGLREETAAAHNFLTGVGTNTGRFTAAQPVAADISLAALTSGLMLYNNAGALGTVTNMGTAGINPYLVNIATPSAAGAGQTKMYGSAGTGICGIDSSSVVYCPIGAADFPFASHSITAGASAILNMAAAPPTTGLAVPTAAGAAPTADGQVAFNSTTHLPVWGSNGSTLTGIDGTGTSTFLAYFNGTTHTLGSITNWFTAGLNLSSNEISTPTTPAASTQKWFAKAGTGGCTEDSGAIVYCMIGAADFAFSGHTITGGASAILNMGASPVTTGLKVPSAASAAPTADGQVAFDTTTHLPEWGSNGNTVNAAMVLPSSGNTAYKVCALHTDSGCNNTADAITSIGTNTAFGPTVTIPVLNQNHAIVTCWDVSYTSSSSPPTSQIVLQAGSTTIYSNTTVVFTASMTGQTSELCFTLGAVDAAGATANTVTSPLFNVPGWNAGQSRNATAQPVQLATNAAITLTLNVLYSAATSGNNMNLLFHRATYQ